MWVDSRCVFLFASGPFHRALGLEVDPRGGSTAAPWALVPCCGRVASHCSAGERAFLSSLTVTSEAARTSAVFSLGVLLGVGLLAQVTALCVTCSGGPLRAPCWRELGIPMALQGPWEGTPGPPVPVRCKACLQSPGHETRWILKVQAVVWL